MSFIQYNDPLFKETELVSDSSNNYDIMKCDFTSHDARINGSKIVDCKLNANLLQREIQNSSKLHTNENSQTSSPRKNNKIDLLYAQNRVCNFNYDTVEKDNSKEKGKKSESFADQVFVQSDLRQSNVEELVDNNIHPILSNQLLELEIYRKFTFKNPSNVYQDECLEYPKRNLTSSNINPVSRQQIKINNYTTNYNTYEFPIVNKGEISFRKQNSNVITKRNYSNLVSNYCKINEIKADKDENNKSTDKFTNEGKSVEQSKERKELKCDKNSIENNEADLKADQIIPGKKSEKVHCSCLIF